MSTTFGYLLINEKRENSTFLELQFFMHFEQGRSSELLSVGVGLHVLVCIETQNMIKIGNWQQQQRKREKIVKNKNKH